MGLPILNMDGYLLKRIKKNTADLTQETADRTAADTALQQELYDLRQAGVNSLILTDLNTVAVQEQDVTLELKKIGSVFVGRGGVGTTYTVANGKKEYGVLGLDVRDWSSYTNSGTSVCRCTIGLVPKYYTDGSTTAYLRLPPTCYEKVGGTNNFTGFSSELIFSQILAFQGNRHYSFDVSVSLEWNLAEGDTIRNEPTSVTLRTYVSHQINE